MTKVYCAIDTTDLTRAMQLAKMVGDAGCGIKLGLEFFTFHGVSGVAAVKAACPDAPIFLDLKLHDIPNTVAGALRAVARIGVAYVNVHAAGGGDMMRAGLNALNEESARLGIAVPKLLAVTVLTSLDEAALQSVGQQGPAESQVLRLARLTNDAGLAGIVCSGKEIVPVRTAVGKEFILMVPGIRPSGSDVGDQKRVMTPQDAMAAGATHLVIGRPITEAADPARAAADIFATL